MPLNDFVQPNVYDCYRTLSIFSVLLLSTDHYLEDSKKNERTAPSHSRKGPAYEVLVAYTTLFKQKCITSFTPTHHPVISKIHKIFRKNLRSAVDSSEQLKEILPLDTIKLLSRRDRNLKEMYPMLIAKMEK